MMIRLSQAGAPHRDVELAHFAAEESIDTALLFDITETLTRDGEWSLINGDGEHITLERIG